jgi:hypothetical protein
MSADFGVKAFGGPGLQHAISENNNALAVKAHTGGKKRVRGGKKSVLVPLALTAMNHLVYKRLREQSRGQSQKRRTNSLKRGGKGVLTALAVPASLVALNHIYANRNKSQNNKDRGTRRRRFTSSRR